MSSDDFSRSDNSLGPNWVETRGWGIGVDAWLPPDFTTLSATLAEQPPRGPNDALAEAGVL